MKLALDQYRLLGSGVLRVSLLCLGKMTFGTDWGWGADKETSQIIFNTYADDGGNFIAPIISARKIDQLQDNLGCFSVELSAEHLQRLNTASQPKPIFPNNSGATEMFRSAVDGESQIEGGFVDIYRKF